MRDCELLALLERKYTPLQLEGYTQRVAVRSLITGPGDLWEGTGWAFCDHPLESTLMVWRGAAARLSADLRVAATYARPTEPSIPLDLGYPDLAPPIKAAFSVPNPSSPASNSHD